MWTTHYKRSDRWSDENQVALSTKCTDNHIMEDENIWEQMETHMHQNLGIYGLKMLSAFLDLKEQAEDCGMCPADTEERQQRFEQMHGEAHAPGSR